MGILLALQRLLKVVLGVAEVLNRRLRRLVRPNGAGRFVIDQTAC